MKDMPYLWQGSLGLISKESVKVFSYISISLLYLMQVLRKVERDESLPINDVFNISVQLLLLVNTYALIF